ncbi:MAG: hypothetical protein ACYDHZ_06400 [Dehalococcoidia bacterium]
MNLVDKSHYYVIKVDRKTIVQKLVVVLLVSALICLFACSSVGTNVPSPLSVPQTLDNEITPSVNLPPPAPTIQSTDNNTIPRFIIEKADQFIISQVGKDYFTKYISLDSLNSKYFEADRRYDMTYLFKIPESPWVNGTIYLAVDAKGIINEKDAYGIPNCLKDPRKCKFPIDEQMAIDIAKSAGLEASAIEWKTSFHWYAGKYNTYVWTVENTFGTSYNQGMGRGVAIDANTGNVLEIYNWSIVQ